MKRKLCSLSKRMRDNERGSVAVMAGLALPLVIGFGGLAVETSVWYSEKGRMQTAADLAAHAAAIELEQRGLDQDAADAVAINQAGRFGYSYQETETLASESSDGIRVDVEISHETQRYFSSIFSQEKLKMEVTASAIVESSGEACLLALDASGNGVVLGGNTDMRMNNCLVASNATSNASLSVSGSADLSATCAGVVGEADIQKDDAVIFDKCNEVREGIKPVIDPYAAVPLPDLDSDDFEDCVDTGGKGKKGGFIASLKTGRYCGGLTFSSIRNIEHGATLVIDGGTFKNQGPATLIGNDVTIILINDARISLTSQATMLLSAKSTGDYAGLLFMGDAATQSESHRFNGGSLTRLTGAVYLPTDSVELRGGANMTTGCLHFIAGEIDARGNSRMSNNCDGVGTKPLVVTGGVRMVKS